MLALLLRVLGIEGRLGDGYVPCAQGGSDFDEDFLVALCRPCHNRTDTPYQRGRLVITAMGYGIFRFEYIWRATKWEVRGEVRELCPSWANASSITASIWPNAIQPV